MRSANAIVGILQHDTALGTDTNIARGLEKQVRMRLATGDLLTRDDDFR
jgi:hypothetical protein